MRCEIYPLANLKRAKGLRNMHTAERINSCSNPGPGRIEKGILDRETSRK
jgi:hypothetical protein